MRTHKKIQSGIADRLQMCSVCLERYNASTLSISLKRLLQQANSIYKDISVCVARCVKREYHLDSSHVMSNAEKVLQDNVSIIVLRSKQDILDIILLSEELDQKVRDLGQTLMACTECYKSTAHLNPSWTSILHSLLGLSEILKASDDFTSLLRESPQSLLRFTDQPELVRQDAFIVPSPQRTSTGLLQTLEPDQSGSQDTTGSSASS